MSNTRATQTCKASARVLLYALVYISWEIAIRTKENLPYMKKGIKYNEIIIQTTFLLMV